MKKEDFVEAYDFTIRCIDREDSLVSHRLNWALFVNVALIALIYNLKNIAANQSVYSIIFYGVCFFGILFTTFSYCGVWAAQKQIKYLKRYLEEISQKVTKPFFVIPSKHIADGHDKSSIEDVAVNGKPNFGQKSSLKFNSIELRTGFPRPFGHEGYRYVKEAGRWVPRSFIITMAILWAALGLSNFLYPHASNAEAKKEIERAIAVQCLANDGKPPNPNQTVILK